MNFVKTANGGLSVVTVRMAATVKVSLSAWGAATCAEEPASEQRMRIRGPTLKRYKVVVSSEVARLVATGREGEP